MKRLAKSDYVIVSQFVHIRKKNAAEITAVIHFPILKVYLSDQPHDRGRIFYFGLNELDQKVSIVANVIEIKFSPRLFFVLPPGQDADPVQNREDRKKIQYTYCRI